MADFESIKMTSVTQLDGYASDSYRCGAFSIVGEGVAFQEIEWTRRHRIGNQPQFRH